MWRNVHAALSFFIAFIITALFFSRFDLVIKERRDPFNESEIKNTINRHGVDAVVGVDDGMINAGFIIKDIPERISRLHKSKSSNYWYSNDAKSPYRTLAYVNRYAPICPSIFDKIKTSINADPQRPALFGDHLADYGIIYSKEVLTDIEIDFSKRTENYPKSLYIQILRKRI